MKNLKCLCICFLMMFMLSLSVTGVSANTNQSFDTNAIELFNDMQEEVDNSLTLVDNKYVYNEDDIYKIVSSYDVDSINEYFGTDFTTKSLADKMITKIDEYVYTPEISLRGTYYNRNYKTVGWNYNRWFTSQSMTNTWVRELEFASEVQGDASILAGCVSLIPGYGGAGVASLGWAITSKWNSSFAAALEKANRAGGLVSDVNTIIPYYTITAQINFYE